ncbi:MAG TPA: putative baseplate assembly protein [Dehalococcoidia bacterium]|nr:putative baseplate assembly protein [Dehalococcoidia bacterium]
MMTLQTPNLDDRKFQDIVSEARSKIPLYCPKWTDYNLSDPGITLIEIFAWMVDMLLYRLNRVPEKNYIKFMDLIGIRLEPPKPANVNVTFRLSAPQPEPVTIPRGAEVATVRTETQDAISFTTNQDFTILLPTLVYALTTHDDNTYTDVMPALKNPDLRVPVFQEVPQENDTLYLGYSEDLAAHTLLLTIQSSIEGIGVDPEDPPWAWEYWDGEHERWSPLRLESDTTGGLNTNGHVILHLPLTGAMKEVNGQYACWIRCRAIEPRSGQGAYGSSPMVRSIISESIGGTVPASHALRVTNELLGQSDGTHGQRFQLQNVPVMSREPGETVEVETENEGEFEPWQEVGDFADSGPTDPHFICDSVSGEIQFGPSIRQPSGEERQYGRLLPNGRRVRFTSYRSGGGVIGNVGEGTITVLKSSIPYVDSVVNFEGARGGTDAETLEHAKLRAPRILRANTRAVTNEDFEYLALEASPRVARARCISPGDTADPQGPPPGAVRLLLVPPVAESEGYIPAEQLEVPKQVREEVKSYLDERRLLATRLDIDTPQYVPVAVAAQVRVKRGSDHQQVMADVERRLYHYINPAYGGADGNGWPFGRSLSLSEVYAVLQGINKVDYIEEVKIFPVDPETGQQQETTARISIAPYSLLCSHKHEVTVVE